LTRILGRGLDPPAGKLHVFPLQGGGHIAGGHLVGPELVGIQPDPHLPELEPPDAQGPHARDALDLVLQNLVHVGGQLANALLPREIDPQDRVRIGVHLPNDGVVDVRRQLGADHRDLLADILDGQVDVALQDELHGDAGDSLAARGRDGLDALDGVDGLLDLVRHVDIHDLGLAPLRTVSR
jgi:hypothetical protein